MACTFPNKPWHLIGTPEYPFGNSIHTWSLGYLRFGQLGLFGSLSPLFNGRVITYINHSSIVSHSTSFAKRQALVPSRSNHFVHIGITPSILLLAHVGDDFVFLRVVCDHVGRTDFQASHEPACVVVLACPSCLWCSCRCCCSPCLTVGTPLYKRLAQGIRLGFLNLLRKRPITTNKDNG